jgi:hypothetical protein
MCVPTKIVSPRPNPAREKANRTVMEFGIDRYRLLLKVDEPHHTTKHEEPSNYWEVIETSTTIKRRRCLVTLAWDGEDKRNAIDGS